MFFFAILQDILIIRKNNKKKFVISYLSFIYLSIYNLNILITRQSKLSNKNSIYTFNNDYIIFLNTNA